ncbi:methyltransferase domain-containing protein [Pseudofulvimonas gallinarii]|uniref:Methyltransferase family protein n=1 Tax=Pseudofulvimonas gallinarii TaxID=634155 RepID=A0A4V3UUB2_9GAMM|nr:methyltransferase domain-containing protein [Pseudofulvimonas gallinarii]TCS98223.1 methyltransferase family protein [Pseudofulvimonas gallinarii]THD13801.1 hypothetical protein B1808_06040 [Pseudofulvimonas gallinarii]
MGHVYDQHFMDYTASASRHAAMKVAAMLREPLALRSVLDVGCATGTWLAAWRESGIEDIHGADGDYVRREHLLIPEHCFHAADLSRPLDLGRRFDLVQSLEVAEHVDAACADQFVANLVNHASGVVLFSAAPPGQGGEYHINEQPLDYWREKFARHGYRAFDAIRPQLLPDAAVPFWYRFNTLLYVHDSRIAGLPGSIVATRIGDGHAVPDPSPALFRLRRRVVASLPYAWQQGLARLKARVLRSGRF